ncbi:ATP-grasp domain-containing protein [Streptomyces sp. NPDC048420]|uniref:ATP-grasp domain-containing protein n=1 Tax=Streptomyces sp. NPDC048420 TaxID=3155755 RepID=UPI00341B160B
MATTVLVLGDGPRPYHEHLLQQIASAHPVVLAGGEPRSWGNAYARHRLDVDLADGERTAAAVRRFAATTEFGGICTYLEHHIELAARLAATLGLPHSSPASMAACRDKAEARRLFDLYDVPSARSRLVADAEDAVEFAHLLRYPVVIKPRGLAGSTAVVRADSDDQVRTAFQHARRDTFLGLDASAVPGVLVEEYLTGPEISAETVVLGTGEVRVVAITRKQLGPEPRFQETGHSVDALDPLLHDQGIARTVAAAVTALGVTRGVLHVELRLTKRGPVLIEVNGRPGGDLITLLVALATGIDLARATAALATGTTPDLTPTRQRAAAIQFLYPALGGEVAGLDADEALRSERWLERLVWTRETGDEVSAFPASGIDDRLGHWVVTGMDAATCQARLATVPERILARINAPVPTTNGTR